METHFIKYNTHPENPEEDLKKKLTFIDLKTEYFTFLDETSCQKCSKCYQSIICSKRKKYTKKTSSKNWNKCKLVSKELIANNTWK